MKRLTLLATLVLLAGSAPAYAADQIEPVALRVDVPEAAPTEAEDAAAAAAAEMVQSILGGADEGAAWDELATVLEERSMAVQSSGATDAVTATESGWAATLSSEWARVESTLRGETAWTLETVVVIAIAFLLLIALLSTVVAFIRRRVRPSRPRARRRRGGAPAASDAVRLAKRLEARRV